MPQRFITYEYVFTTALPIEPRINTCFDPLTHGLFLTCTEGIFSFYTGHTSNIKGICSFLTGHTYYIIMLHVMIY
jgi:hypothetical protein